MDEIDIDHLIYFEERNGWPYYIVEGKGFWDRELARAYAQIIALRQPIYQNDPSDQTGTE